ncbi:MAG: class I tRNA ligase family protein [Minisyncoccota bacterium]
MADTPEKSDAAKREEAILAFWNDQKIFEKSLEKESPEGDFVFYDGPPFATGTPHYGHIVASVIKDAIPRYKTMRGYHVPRVWGWDTHGLPIENIVEKELGFKHKKDIVEYGVAKFNEQCRTQVMAYVDEWKKVIPRIGRFVDMEHPYTTMDASFMESVWQVFKQVYEKGLVYEDYRSMHVCPRCETTLSQQEVAEGYKDVKDISVTVKFKVKPNEKLSGLGIGTDVTILAWTTTPWTLPGNVALAVGLDISYRAVQYESGKYYLVAKERMAALGLSDPNMGTEFSGRNLVGLEYEPPFEYYKKDASLKNHENGWKVYAADFVTTDTGTGIVHIAPAFGEDDMALGKKENLPFVQHVAYDGTMKSEVTDFAGREVKPRSDDDRERLATDIEIIKYLQEHGTFFSKENLVHSYPHCWRCDTPLLNYATTSWFIAVTKIKDDLLDTAKDINWSPAHIKEGRFGKWLEGARDWSISRQRFWASVIPIWKDENGNVTVIGSIDELKKHVKKSGNTYFMMRHGESEKNIKNIASSDPTSNNLTARGKEEVRDAARALAHAGGVDVLYASPFMRTRETVEIISEELGIETSAIIFDERLRELGFGSLSGKPIEEFIAYRAEHMPNFTEPTPGGESYADVKRRVGECLYEIESTVHNKRVLIVTHGAGLEALTTLARGGDAKMFAEVVNTAYFKTGEMRSLDFTPLPHNGDYELDLHRPYIDEIALVNEAGEPLTRVPDVLDTWFDSGSMPYAARHYPFENKEDFERSFPAQFIAEGVDQTRAWFYYLHVLSGALFGKPAFQNVIVNGIMLAEDGKKMSKSKKNYPDPMLIVEKYGADALRFYLLASPVVQAENLAFVESGVDEIAKKNVGRLMNVLSFYKLYEDGTEANATSANVLDRWILARLHELVRDTTAGYESYELDRAVRPLTLFIDDLSAWYVRRSRDRFKEEGEDKTAALATLRYVLCESAKVMAPAMPFIADEVFRAVRAEDDPISVHLTGWPEVSFTSSYEQGGAFFGDMALVRELASAALQLRQKAGIKVRQPLAAFSASVVPNHPDLIELLKDEINVKRIEEKEGDMALDTALTPELIKEGDERELASAVMQARKAEGFLPHEVIHTEISHEGKYVASLSTGVVRFDLIGDASR